MIGIVPDYFAGEAGFIVDGRASKRDVGTPRMVRLYRCPSFNEALPLAMTAEEIPVAIVKPDGTAFILTAGGSGHIWVCGDVLNVKQQVTVDRLRDVMISIGGAFDPSNDLSGELFPGFFD